MTGRGDSRRGPGDPDSRRRALSDGGPGGPRLPEDCPAAYVFRVTVRFDPDEPGVWADPDEVVTTVFRSADPPGDPGWLYFRDNLWHGELSDSAFMREVASDALGARVARITFRELRTTRSYLDDLRAAVAADLDSFAADSVDAVLSNYLGSSVHVVDES